VGQRVAEATDLPLGEVGDVAIVVTLHVARGRRPPGTPVEPCELTLDPSGTVIR
jgi:hypothetical protein